MKTHEKNIKKTVDILMVTIASLLFIVAGLLTTIKIFFGQYLNNFSEILAFLSSFVLMGFLGMLPLVGILSLIADALGVHDIYEHAYDDGFRDKCREINKN